MKDHLTMPARLALACLLVAVLPGCRKEPPPPAPARPAAATAPAIEISPVPTTSPASAPASAPSPASAPAPTLEALTKLLANVQAKREDARKAQAYRDSFEAWDLAQARQAAGAEAAGNGQPDRAAQCLADAAETYDRIVKLSAALTQARSHVSAQRYPEATAALAGVSDAPAAMALREEIRLAAGQKDLLPAKTQAEAAVAAAVALPDAHGFGAIQLSLRQELRKAAAHYARGRFTEAGAAYKALVTACERVKVLEAARQATETLRGQVDAARARAAAADAFAGANAMLTRAAAADETAAKAQAAGDFDPAKSQWTAALGAYEQAATTGAALQAARGQLAGRQFAAAATAVQAVAKAQPDNQAAAALAAEIATAQSREEAAALQAASIQAVTGIASLDSAGPFGEWKAALWARHLRAERLMTDGKFTDAAKEFRSAVAECERLRPLEVARQTLTRTLAAVSAQRQAGISSRAHRAAPGRWERAEAEFAAGQAAFQKGDYEGAKTTWAAAAR